MQPITKLIFTGVDGSKYKFDVYPRDIRVNNGPAIYSFLSKVNGNYHVLYIGQTIDLSERLANCARARKWNGFSRKVERSSQLMERLMAHEFSQNGTALAPIWNDPLSNRDAPVILSQWNGNP